MSGSQSPRAATRRRRLADRARRFDGWGVLALPAVALLVVFHAFPTLRIVREAFTDFRFPQVGGWDNIDWVVGDEINRRIMWRSLRTAIYVTLLCLLLGYPYAYLMTVVRPRTRQILVGLVVIAAFTSFMVRNYAWLVLLADNGVINDTLEFVGIGRVRFVGNISAVLVALVQILLPLMILPVYATMRGIDRRYLAAATSLGASPTSAFIRAFVPLSVSGVISGSLLVFVITVGFYVTPTLLGSPSNALIAQLIVNQTNQSLAFGRAGALSLLLLVVVAATLVAVGRTIRSVVVVPEQSGGAVGLAASDEFETTGLGRKLLVGFGTFVAALLVAPSLIVIPQSFNDKKSLAFPPQEYSFRWYENFFADSEWTDTLVNSLRVGVLATAVAMVVGMGVALALVRGRLPLRGAVYGLVLLPLLIPMVVYAIGTYSTFLDWRLVGKTWGFVVAHTVLALPFVVIPLMAGLAAYDTRLDDAASSLGASRVTTFLRVSVPVLMPSVAAAALFGFVTSFDEITVALFLSTPRMSTLPVQMYTAVTRNIDPTIAAASTLILIVMTLLMLVVGKLNLRTGRG